MRSRLGETLLVIGAVLLAATTLMLLVHFWRLPGLLAAVQPLARGAIAFFLGGAALYTIRDVGDSGSGSSLARGSLRFLLCAGLFGVYLVPTYCSFRHYRSDLASSANSRHRELAQALDFRTFVHLIGTNTPVVKSDDIPDGDGFFDLLVGIAMIVDIGVQKLFTNVFHLGIAGYVSLLIWYLMFLFFAYSGCTLFYDRYPRPEGSVGVT